MIDYTYENIMNNLQKHYENITTEYIPITLEDRILCNKVPIKCNAPIIVMEKDDYCKYVENKGSLDRWF